VTALPIRADSLLFLLAPVWYIFVVVKIVKSPCGFFDVMMDRIQVITTQTNDVEKSITFTRMAELIRYKGDCTLDFTCFLIHGYTPLHSLDGDQPGT
jgi:hypothetical protein